MLALWAYYVIYLTKSNGDIVSPSELGIVMFLGALFVFGLWCIWLPECDENEDSYTKSHKQDI